MLTRAPHYPIHGQYSDIHTTSTSIRGWDGTRTQSYTLQLVMVTTARSFGANNNQWLTCWCELLIQKPWA
jgi:hypothetical protein